MQPWATLIAIGEKKFETRSWATKYRGELAIHSSKKIDKEAIFNPVIVETLEKYGVMSLNDLPTGVVLAKVELVNCWHIVIHPGTDVDVAKNIPIGGELDVPRHHPDFHRYIVPTEKEMSFGDWTPGRYAWELANVKMLDKPIPAKGQLGLWNFQTSDFEVVYEVPPMRGLYRTVVNAISSRAAEEKIRTDPETTDCRIKEINEIK